MKRFQTVTFALILLFLPLLAPAHDVFYPTGTYYHGETDLRVAARGVPMVWERSYRSNRIVKRSDSQTRDFKHPVDGLLGFGWHTPFTVRIDNGDIGMDFPKFHLDMAKIFGGVNSIIKYDDLTHYRKDMSDILCIVKPVIDNIYSEILAKSP